MSSSETQVTVRLADGQGELEIVDGRFRVVRGGFGTVTAALGPGIYKARARAGGVQREELFAVAPDAAPFEVCLAPLLFDSPVPLERTATDQGDQRQALRSLTAEAPADLGLGAGAALLLSLRDTAAPDARHARGGPAAYGRSFDGFRLLRPDGAPLVNLDEAAARAPGEGMALLNLSLEPGPYILEFRREGCAPLAMPLHAVPGWQTQLFVTVDARGEAPGRPDLAGRSLMMAPLGERFHDEEGHRRLAEIARHALMEGRPTLTRSQLHRLLSEKFHNPILGLLGAHLLLLRREPNRELIETVTYNTATMIGPGFPDVLALRIALAELAGDAPELPAQGLSFPPLLRPSWDLLTRYPQLLPRGSLPRAVGARLVADGPWLAWSPREADAEPHETDAHPLIRQLAGAFLPGARGALSRVMVEAESHDAFKSLTTNVGRWLRTAADGDRPLTADDGTAALRAIRALAERVPWESVFARLKAETGGRFAGRLSTLQRSLLPTLQLIRAQLAAGESFTLSDVEQLREGLDVPLPVLREGLEDLVRGVVAGGAALLEAYAREEREPVGRE